MDTALWYMHNERMRERNRERNEAILNRQVFMASANHREIEIQGTDVQVLNVEATAFRFGHQPGMLTPALSQALRNPTAGSLGKALSAIYKDIITHM